MDIERDDLVKQFRASGLTQKAFCTHKNIKHAHLRYLLYRKNNPSKKATTFAQSSQPAFIRLDEQFLSTHRSAPDTLSGCCTIIHGRFSIRQLAELVAGLRDVC
jgi:hypothetical protein